MNILDQVLVPPVSPDQTMTNSATLAAIPDLTEMQRALIATNLMPAVNTLPAITVCVGRLNFLSLRIIF